MINMKVISAFAFALAMTGTSFAAEEVVGKYGAVTIKKVHNEAKRNSWETRASERVVAYIDDSSDEAPVIPEDIKVDSVYYSRVFKSKVASTLMLPFSVPTWKLSGLSAFEFVKIMKYSDHFQVQVRSTYANEIKANTPYIIVNEMQDTTISFNMDNVYPDQSVTLNTTTGSRHSVFSGGGYDWNVIGTYERIEFKKPKGIYGFAAKAKNDTKVGDFKKAACSEKSCAYIRPFRAYMKCTLTEETPSKVKGLAKTAETTVASLDSLPETVAVHVISDSTGGTTFIGTINTRTGEFSSKEDNRWFDMKGRLLQHKPTAKGTYFHNRKKVVIK